MADSISDFPEHDSIRSLLKTGAVGGAGRITGVEVAEIRYAPDDAEKFLLFTVETANQPPRYLTIAHSPSVNFDQLKSFIEDERPEAYFLGVDFAPKNPLKRLDGALVAGTVLAQLPSFPLIVGIEGSGVATSLTSSSAIPATQNNLGPLQQAGLDVRSFQS